jgi:large subunit ribosomal protein L13
LYKTMRQYHLFDAKKEVLGRMATQIATILSGKNKVTYTSHIDDGDFVVVINSDLINVTGNKTEDKKYHHFSGYPGGIKTLTLKQKMEKDSSKVIREAVMGMLPKNKLRKERIKRLFIFKDENHNKKIEITH